ncbi:MAG: DoxX family membrane protein [Acidimicrobiales bacterium]
MHTSLASAAVWAAVLRIGLGLWWLESFRHKNLTAWIKRQAGINWAADIAGKHKWKVVGAGFDKIVRPHPKAMTWVVLMSELALGLGLTLGFLTPVAAFASIALNLVYFTLMIHDWAEQALNLLMALAAAVILGLHGWQVWSIDHVLFGAGGF